MTLQPFLLYPDAWRIPRDPHRLHFDERYLAARLQDTSLTSYQPVLLSALQRQAAALRHGRLPHWRAALASLPRPEGSAAILHEDVVQLAQAQHEQTPQQRVDRGPAAAARYRALQSLLPWRKGPFRLGDTTIDSEWRCQRKWSRLATAIEPLCGRQVLDVGCGNGYYLWRMRGAGAAMVVGIDPGLLFYMQFQALQHHIGDPGVVHLPLTLEAMPVLEPASGFAFDTVFSMGVLYHRRDPAAHLAALSTVLRPAGQLVLETLVWPGERDLEHRLVGRYARMRNIWCLPTVRRVERWLQDTGFYNPRCISISITNEDEQRSTEWMPWQSLGDALDPSDPSKTIEGHPRPHRAILLATRRIVS